MSEFNHSLLFFLAPRGVYRETLISKGEIFCGPDAVDQKSGAAWKSVSAPAGVFDVEAFCGEKGISLDQEVVLVKADATGRNFPSNLGVFKCPKVLLVGDTHHMQAPIRKLIEYAKSEPFDRIIFDHTRHHARWFFEAGFENLHWIPALDFSFHNRAIASRPNHKLTFVGQAGRFHPYRCHVLEELKRAGLPLEVMQTTPGGAADIYADSLITLNIALNGDLNLRVFEALSAGGFLMTDRLTESSGLEALFTPGEDLEVWTGTEELVEKIRFYLANPAEAFLIRRAGQAKLLERHSPEVKIREFWDLVLHGRENPAYSLEAERGAVSRISAGSPLDMLPAYEFFQELHRNKSKLIFYCAEGEGERVRRFVDLPRVELRTHAEWYEAELNEDGDFPEERILHLGKGVDTAVFEEILLKHQPKMVFAPGGDPGVLLAWGYGRMEEGIYECVRPVLGIVKRARALGGDAAREMLLPCVDLCVTDEEALEVADACDAVGLDEARKEALLRAVFLNRDCVSALIQLADLSLESGALVDAALLLSEANRVAPLPDAIAPVFCELMEKLSESPPVLEYKQALAGGNHPIPTVTRKILVVTNLFPPQELGGYGRKLWEFSAGLVARGHDVLILTSDSKYLDKTLDKSEMALENRVRRVMGLTGEWRDGRVSVVGGPAERDRIIKNNAALVLKAAGEFRPDFVLLGNLDFMGVTLLQKLLERGLPVIHSLGNEQPGYKPEESIESPLYAIAPASDWLGKNLLQQGYKVSKLSTVYPGARLDRFFKRFLPDIRRLRIAFAGLVMPYKGAHVLMDALIILKKLGIEFEADFAGDSTDAGYIRVLKEFAQNNGIGTQVRFNGFLDRQGLAALFARCNVLVFPTQIPEAFGISQVEAMASGLIVITSGTGGTKEVIRHGLDGLVFEMGNAASLAQNLLALATNKDLRDKLQIDSQKRSMEFSVTQSVVRIESIAEDLISLKSGKSSPAQQGSCQNNLPSMSSKLLMDDISQHLNEALDRFSKGRLSDAEETCREILGKNDRCAGAWALLGQMALLNGDLETAGDFALVACELDPGNAGFLRGLGEVFLRRKDLEAAEGQARRALELEPEDSESLVLLGRVLAEKGEKGNSLGVFEKALRLKKDDAEAITHYAMALQKFDRGKDAISQIRKACSLEPDSVEHQTNFASLLEQNKRYVDALAAYGKAARMNPDVGYIWFRQGKLLNGLKRHAEAIPILEKAIAMPGMLGEYFYEMGLAFHMSKRFPEALQNYEKALAAGYNTAALQCNRGVIFKELRRGGDAIIAFHNAVEMDPSNVSYLNNLGAAALEIGLNTEALGCFEEAVRQNPKIATAQNNIGNLLKDRARGMDALPHYRKSMELDPSSSDTQSNYLLCHMYLSEMDPKTVFEEHRKWGLEKAKKTPPAFKFKPRTPGSKLRVGFLSGDLCHHPVAHFIEPLFREYNKERFEFIAYGDQRKSDDFSARFAQQVDLWRETCSLTDEALAKKIHEDRLDILFELSGHTAYNRLPVLAMKPAPLQASYLGYPGTTGLPTIDFRITDALVDPQGMTEKFHTERLIRLPRCAWCYEPDAISPDVGPLPAVRNGYISFGCFNNMAKLNRALFDMWAEILLKVPGSHLRLKAKTLTDEGVKEELKNYFSEKGIAAERLDFFGHTKRIIDHLTHYNEVDIALDSYPYHGTTTTCEAFWMGCPVVTRAGAAHVSRVGVSLLSAVGLEEFIGQNREDYIGKAAALAGDIDRLVELREGMRDRLKSSPLMNAPDFAREFEVALLQMAEAR
jgi:predicted O-linked N-acetylglucosamine transferase (SPINDLY family)/glycosyltransferase involved in cell wall biosynthesis